MRNSPVIFRSLILAAALVSPTFAAEEPASANDATAGIPAIPTRLKNFIAAKEQQISRLAEKLGLEVVPEARDYLALARKGDWSQAVDLYRSVRDAVQVGSDDPDQKTLNATTIHAILELQLAFEQIMDTDVSLATQLGDEMIRSVRPGSIYFGGTDAGRGLVTALSASHEKGDPFFTVTQNALADGTYLNYLRTMYGEKTYMPTSEDSQKAFQDYLRDAEARLKHDRDYPNEPKQIRPGENVRFSKNRVEVSGQVAVMGINALLARVIFDQNPDREFFVEQSFPFDWMYPHLEPHGMLLKLNREPLNELSSSTLARDQEYWLAQQSPLIGSWLKPDTSVEEICRFAEKVHVNHNLAGFTGDKKFIQTEGMRKNYSKLRSAIAGLYAWRAGNATDPKARDRMWAAADFAYRQSIAFCPDSAEAVNGYVNQLLARRRATEAARVANLAANLNPEFDELASRVRETAEKKEAAK